ncbi:hypothetical protein HO932_05400 [Streptococcus suis]|nr:hypothetical protein [Streptococcus suis]NQN95534.1 hypothetical protein [Streptococcus suis]NQO33046.1 hypothetical protein [Streptococcus suis]NQO43414.1 hypothetical protein [Streptococcus suis]NQO53970.1 hypothetical protein [Streptococcus suis]
MNRKPDYIIIQEAMMERIRFLEDELYNRAYKDIERQEVEIEKLKDKCVDLMLENADYVWDEMAKKAAKKRANTRKWRAKTCI